VDFDQTKLFQDTTPFIAPIQSRKLKLEDPRIVSKYIEALDKQIAYHKLNAKINIMHQDAITRNLPMAWSKSYERLDKLLTESMLYAESVSAKENSGKFQWSPVLKVAVKATQFWSVLLKQAKGLQINEAQKQRLLAEADLREEVGQKRWSIPEIINQLRQTRADLRQLQKQHIQLRANYLEALADARIQSKNEQARTEKRNQTDNPYRANKTNP
jgi:hypothetical protein